MVDERVHLPRHQMAWIGHDAWAAMIAKDEAFDTDALIQGWAENGWPLVARSRGDQDPDDMIALGVPLPPSHGKKRYAFCCGSNDVVHTEGPPLLAYAAAATPPAWLTAISAVLLLDTETRCFGSLAWEHLTGLPYVTTGSDLDLLWHVASETEADHLAAEIARIDLWAPASIDGEFITPSGAGVQWREWRSNEPTVLVKTPEGAKLSSRDEVFP